MKARVIRIVFGWLCIIAAFWLGCLALTLFTSSVLPKLTAGPNVRVHETVIIGSHQLQGWELYAVPAVAAFATIAMLGGGLFLIRSREMNRK